MLIENNKVCKMGTFDDILQAGFDIEKILDSFNQNKKKDPLASLQNMPTDKLQHMLSSLTDF